MNDELTNKLNESGLELLEWMKGAAEKGGDFVAEQAPLLATEIVAWHFWSSVFIATVAVVAAVAMFACSVCFYRWSRCKKWYSDPEVPIDGDCKEYHLAPSGILCALSLFALLVVAVPCAYEAVKASVAPRIVLIEYAGKALGGRK